MEFLFNISNNDDVVYTPRNISKLIIGFLNPIGKIIDPCKGDGSFFDFLPNADYCEIKEGRDFFNYKSEVDWVIGNPPYSIFKDFLFHSFLISKEVSFLVPVNKVFQSQEVMNRINKFGGIYSIIVFGSGHKLNFPFGYSVANFHFKKNFRGNTNIVLGLDKIFNSSYPVITEY